MADEISMARALSAGVASGAFTEAGGLVAALRMLAGELSVAEVFPGQTLISAEGTGIVRQAKRYLDNPANTEGRVEVARRLAILLPARETLDRFSRPASASAGGRGLAHPWARPVGDAVECRLLWSSGFELEADGTPTICLEYAEVVIGGVAHRIYYPAYWEADAPERALLEPTRQALETSLETYNAYGPRPVVGTDIVFTDLGAVDEGRPRDDVLAAADDVLRANRCHVAVFPTGVYFGLRPPRSAGAPDGTAIFQQTIAHELFHCYQYTNLAPQESGPADHTNDWWVEGSAEYFGSVVYPSVNAEHTYLGALDSQSPSSALITMDYPAYAFFEYLHAQAGYSPESIIRDVLGLMPTSGGFDDQQTSFASLPGMAETFHAFGQDYLDRKLVDLGGGMLPVNPNLGEVKEFPLGRTEAEFPADPLVLHRYTLLFDEEGRFDITHEMSGTGRPTMRPSSSPGLWGDIPDRVDAACDEPEHLLLLTSVVPAGSEAVSLQLEAEGEQVEEGDQACDCLVGTWSLDNDTFLPWADTLLNQGTAGAGIHAQATGVSGEMIIVFTPEGLAKGSQSAWTLSGMGSVGGQTTQTQMAWNGGATASWHSEAVPDTEDKYVVFEDGDFALTSEGVWSSGGIVLAQVPRTALPGTNVSFFLSGSHPYACTASTLTIFGGDLPPVTFTRLADESGLP
jgi:hypothetical protein